jgi:hypothetical protein
MLRNATRHCFPAVALGAEVRRGRAQARRVWGQFCQALLKALAVWAA